jgi:hypothetical protein
LFLTNYISAQNDSIKKRSLDGFLLTRKGIFGKVAKNLLKDTASTELQRNDIRFQKYTGSVIRNIIINDLDFGTSITDTTKNIKNTLVRIANKLHRKTRFYVIRNNLFFSKHDTIQPYLVADNERHLRDQTYLQDASILIRPVWGSRDSVDIIVLVKDVFSIGGSLHSLSLNRTEFSVREDNLGGLGDGLVIRTLYDKKRQNNFGHGFEYIKRNIAGSFIDGYVGYDNFYTGITGHKQGKFINVKFIKPLVNPYMKWTYAFEAAHYETKNMYSSDSLYTADERYKNYNLDAWGGYVFNFKKGRKLDEQRLRGVIGLRYINQKYQAVPANIPDLDWRFSDVTGVLASFSIFRQDFYKVQYIFGFGRNEDVPEGMDISLTAGYTKKQNIKRPHLGINFERFYFSLKKNYINFTARADGYLNHKRFEDINVLTNISYINRLKSLGAKWKQRTFVSAGVTKQVNSLLNEPLILESEFGLPEFRNGFIWGAIRATIKAESVFYAPGTFMFFRFAPFVFYNTSYFKPRDNDASGKLFTTVGAGLRTRNESLVFGTLQLKGYYFPRENFNNGNYRIEFSSNLKFKYNSQNIRRPEFIRVN